MSAVESRLAATLAKHSLQDYQPAGSWSPSPGESWVWCACGVAVTADGSPAQLHAAHVAAVIASSDDLAVIELPEPNKSGFVWVNGHGEVELLDYRRFLPDEAVQLAASILAAAKATEGRTHE